MVFRVFIYLSLTGYYRINSTQLVPKGDKIKKFTYLSCSIINIGINTHEIHKCPRGEIGRHKGLK